MWVGFFLTIYIFLLFLASMCTNCLIFAWYLCLFQFPNDPAWRHQQLDAILAKTATNPTGCKVWLGSPQCKYGKIRYKLPGDTNAKPLYIHRLSYMLYMDNFDLPKDGEISHRCHTPKCICPHHMVLEDHETNQERITSRQQGICTKNLSPHCIF